MPPAFWVSYALLWLLVLVLGLLVVLLYRQLGGQPAAGTPGQPRRPATGPAAGREGLPPGTPVPPVALAWDGAATPARWAPDADGGPGWLLLLTAPGCPTCQAIRDHGAALAAGWPGRTLVWVQHRAADVDTAAVPPPDGWRLAEDPDGAATVALDVPATPFAYAVHPDGTVAAGRRVRGHADVRALLTAAFGAPAPEGGSGSPSADDQPLMRREAT